MSTRLESWSRPADPWRAVVVATFAMAILVAGWVGMHHGFYRHSQIADTPIYQRYGDAIARGQVPYRDFRLEYPPAALPAFALPSLLRSPKGDLPRYEDWFEAEMLLCGGLALTFMLSILLDLGAGPARLAAALGFAAVAPLLLGSVVLSRFDLWVAALVTGALAALVSGRNRLGSGVLGLAFAAKLFPAVLLPLALAWVWRRNGRREAAICLAIFAAVVVACFLPFVLVAPHGVWESVTRQTNRPLQIESLGAGVLLVAHVVAGLGITMRPGHGSQNLAGSLPDAIAAAQTVVQLAAVAAIWVWFARGAATRDRFVQASAAAVCAFVALGKVLSPQFLIWLIPLVPLLRSRRGMIAGGLLGLALVVTQVWFPFRYWRLALQFDTAASSLVLVRDLVLLGLLAVLVWPKERVAPAPPAGAP
jgi:hypothetical protein